MFTPLKDDANYMQIQLIEQKIAGTVSNASGGSVTSSEGVKITLPANAVNGYSGNINLAVKYIDATDAANSGRVPGDLVAQNNNTLGMLESYGMAGIDLLDDAGNYLQLAAGKEATINLPVPASKVSTAPNTIPFWYFDEEEGAWKEEGVGVLTGNKYEGKVKHFSWWNADKFMSTQTFCLTATVNGMPAPNINIEILDKQSGMRATTTLSASANNCLIFPVNSDGSVRNVEVSAKLGDNPCLSPIQTTLTSSRSTLTLNFSTAGSILLPLKIAGSAVNCNTGQLITNGIARVEKESQVFTTIIKNGKFDFGGRLICLPNNATNDAELIIYDTETFKQSAPKTITISNQQYDAGTISTCETITVKKTYVGNLDLSTQQEVDNFLTENYTDIDGTLTISGNNITSLSPLIFLKNITGDFFIDNMDHITSSDGLQNLRTIGKRLIIKFVPIFLK
ncbi:hypothetical protein [Niabella ginsengisoli]|uniref:Uncharacterized protein n=1 Tax=Niabella ginsengisoli TaxID=522298 RepID=A0ABS9SQE1_9BACT|nr:hypothetical protein [Niabella ginsengisoli]MCH5600560.1 hypothetical protein [Niabella ginsengisoli]